MTNEFLRHTLATIGYRFQKAVSNSNEDFSDFKIGNNTRTPNEIICHMYEVLSATRIFILEEKRNKEQSEKLELGLEIDRFNSELKSLDNVLAIKELEINYSKRLLQGPFSDVLTHIGQISMLSGLNGNPIKGEDFSSASIITGINFKSEK
ncbi:hypothetical protein SYJ56_25260 [Algoriphagus sp. D3-2-R+10]|uniref:hypothetical protein n=1 Tax=Algoriphagus aurantiacus TaxID=3103948 RepID=UPI002B3BF250|nr:hypothetical protein [Algoriphagus sp. D3-2-R+10]MEB2778643.1 hypothetical protein [Algoriphagus sp. D3-2-R+10]